MYTFPPTSTVSALGESIEVVSAGGGAATVVFVNGAGGPIEGWHKVFGPVAAFAKVFAYNRPGIGGSSKPAVPQAGAHLVASLRTVLQAAGLPPPYILVGHSLGGLIVNLFARLHPSEVRAVVLLEATSPKDVAVLVKYENGVQRFLKAALERLLPSNKNAESMHVEATVAEIERAAGFPDVPLTVLTGGKPAMAWATPPAALEARAQHQKELAMLAPHAKEIICANSGHFPQFSEPQLVIAAIEEMVRGQR